MDASMPTPRPACALDPDRECLANEKLDLIREDLAYLKRAFPEDEFGEADIVGHRRFHDARIAAAVAEKEFWEGLRRDTIKKGVFFVLVILSGLIVLGILTKVKLWHASLPSLP